MPDYYAPPVTFDSWRRLPTVTATGDSSATAPLRLARLLAPPEARQVEVHSTAPAQSQHVVADSRAVAPLVDSAQFDPGEGAASFFENGQAPANGAGPSPVVIGAGVLALGALAWYFLR